MRVIDTGITKEILSGDNHPQIKIAGDCYTVDDRQSTFDKITKSQEDTTLNEKEKEQKILELALGNEAAKKIADMDLPVSKHSYLIACIMGAIVDKTPEEIMAQAEKKL